MEDTVTESNIFHFVEEITDTEWCNELSANFPNGLKL